VKKLKLMLITSVACSAMMTNIFTAQAEEEAFGGTFSASVAMMNDYRFRGVSLNNEGFALQGSLDWSHDSGFYVGTWATNISDFGGSSIEQDIYAGYSGEVKGFTFDVGGLLYHYPGGSNVDYFELYGSVGVDLGVASATVGMAYDFSSENTGHQDNIYIYTDLEAAIPDTPITLTARLGYEDGFFDNKLDWSFGASVAYKGLDFAVTYIDTDIAVNDFSGNDLADATVVFSVGASF